MNEGKKDRRGHKINGIDEDIFFAVHQAKIRPGRNVGEMIYKHIVLEG